MRKVVIVVMCDACRIGIEEETEGDAAVTFTVLGEQREMDLCGECLSGSFLQEARPVSNRKKRKKQEFACDACDNTFDTQRGMNQHKTKVHG